VVAPELRSNNWSSKPDGVAAYDIDKLAADVGGLIRGKRPRVGAAGRSRPGPWCQLLATLTMWASQQSAEHRPRTQHEGAIMSGEESVVMGGPGEESVVMGGPDESA
jgi:hypothetical protein